MNKTLLIASLGLAALFVSGCSSTGGEGVCPITGARGPRPAHVKSTEATAADAACPAGAKAASCCTATADAKPECCKPKADGSKADCCKAKSAKACPSTAASAKKCDSTGKTACPETAKSAAADCSACPGQTQAATAAAAAHCPEQAKAKPQAQVAETESALPAPSCCASTAANPA